MSGIAITFPGSPAEGQSYLAQNGFTYIYDSQKNRWKRGGDFVRAPKVLSYAGVAVTTTGSGITTGPNGALIYEIPGVVSPSSTAGIDSYKAYRYTDSYPNYTEIQVSISSAFSSVAYAATSTSTTFTIPGATLSGNTTYYLRARQFVGSNASIASTGEISGYSPNVVRFITTSVYLDSPTIVSIAGTTGFPVYQIGFAGTTLPATVTYSGSGAGNLDKVEWRVTGPRNPDSTGDTALAEVGIGTLSSATLANSLVLAMPFSGAAGVGITNDVNNAIRSASGASAGTTKTVTANGNAGIATVGIATTTAHFYNGAAYFDGSGDYLTASYASDFQFGTGDFTVEMWIKTTPGNSTFSIVGQNAGSNNEWGFAASANQLYWQNDTMVNNLFNITLAPLNDGNWHHFVAVRRNSYSSFYYDGVFRGGAIDTTNYNGTETISVGYNHTSVGYFTGYLQDLKIYKGLAKYQENFTPPLPTYGTISYTTSTIGSVGIATTAFLKSTGDIPTAEVAIGSSTAAQVASSLVLALPMNNTFGFQDINVAVRGLTSGASAGTAKTVGLGTTSTANAPTHPFISATESKWYDGAAYFDGGDYLDVTDDGSFDFGTDNFTIEFYIYIPNINTAFDIIGTANNSVYLGGSKSGWIIAVLSTGSIRFGYQSSNSWIFETEFGVLLSSSRWHHVSISRSGTSLMCFVDGVRGNSSTNSTNIQSTENICRVGGGYGSSGLLLTGYLQDLKVYKGFAKYTANFTPPQPICGFTTDLAIQTGFTTTSATGALLSSVVGLGSTSTLAFGADQTYSGITSITSSSGITTLPDTYAQNLVLALPLANITGVGNSFTNDRNTQIRSVSLVGGGSTKTITNTGVTTVSLGSTNTKLYNNAAQFGSGKVLTTSSSSDFNFGTGDFTVEYWLYRTSLGSNDAAVTNYSQVPSGYFICLHSNSTDASLFLNGSSVTSGGTAEANVWNHYAFVRTMGNCRIYKNGVLIASATSSAAAGATNVMNIGAYSNGTSFISGYIQDVRIYNSAKYTTNFTPPPPMFGDYTRSTPNKIVFTPGSDYVLEARNTATGGIVTSTYSASRQWGTKPEGGIYDPYGANLVLAIPGGAVGGATSTFDVTGQIRFETPTATYVNAGIVTYSNSLGIGTYGNKSVTAQGNAVTSATQSKYYGRSIYFDGTGDYLDVTGTTDFDFDTRDYTVECWARYEVNADEMGLFCTNKFIFRVDGVNSSYRVQSWHVDGGATLTGTQQLVADTWHHLAISKFGTTRVIYVNGVEDARGTITQSVTGTTSAVVGTVYLGNANSEEWKGYINDLRVYKGFAKYTANFTPPNQIYLT